MEAFYNEKSECIIRFFADSRRNYKMLEELVIDYRPIFMGKRFLTDAELSNRIGISRRTLQDYRDRGILPFYRLDGKILYEEGDIEKFLQSIYVPKF